MKFLAIKKLISTNRFSKSPNTARFTFRPLQEVSSGLPPNDLAFKDSYFVISRYENYKRSFSTDLVVRIWSAADNSKLKWRKDLNETICKHRISLGDPEMVYSELGPFWTISYEARETKYRYFAFDIRKCYADSV